MANVLLVDDDTEMLKTLTAIIKTDGHAVTTAKEGVAALDILDSGAQIDLIVTDIVMPGLNGLNLVRMAKTRRPSLRVIYLTRHSEHPVVSRDQGDRFGTVLMKPILPAALRAEIDVALRGHSSESVCVHSGSVHSEILGT